jgi:hypothetical protein
MKNVSNSASFVPALKKLFFEFITWKDNFTQYLPLHDEYEIHIETHILEYMSLKKLWKYWLAEIKFK